MTWIRDRALGLLFLPLFLLSRVAQLFAQAAEFVDEQSEHGSTELASVAGG